MSRLHFPAQLFPLLQAVFTAASTASGVFLVLTLRPGWHRRLPFYSDASHNDPERIILAAGENIACALGIPTAIAEYLCLVRLVHSASTAAAPGTAQTTSCPGDEILPVITPSKSITHTPNASNNVNSRISTSGGSIATLVSRVITPSRAVWLNFTASILTTPFFFIVANVPSKFPSTRLHQFAASALILFYALQATLKLYLYHALVKHAHPSKASIPTDNSEIDDDCIRIATTSCEPEEDVERQQSQQFSTALISASVAAATTIAEIPRPPLQPSQYKRTLHEEFPSTSSATPPPLHRRSCVQVQAPSTSRHSPFLRSHQPTESWRAFFPCSWRSPTSVPPVLRLLPVIVLWTALVGTFLCFAARVIIKPWGPDWIPLRNHLALLMAILAHAATASCVLVMAVLAIDLRGQVIILSPA